MSTPRRVGTRFVLGISNTSPFFHFQSLVVVSVIIVSVSATPTGTLDTILSDRNLDTLQRKALAQLRAFDDTGELLGGEDLKGFTEDRGQNGGRPMVDHGCPVAGFSGLSAHIDEAHFEAMDH